MPPTPSLTRRLHRPPSGMKFGLAAIAVGCALVMIASLPASRDLQIAGSICLLTFRKKSGRGSIADRNRSGS